jgi:hypothetical protein
MFALTKLELAGLPFAFTLFFRQVESAILPRSLDSVKMNLIALPCASCTNSVKFGVRVAFYRYIANQISSVHTSVLGTNPTAVIAVIRQGQSSQLHGKLFPSISSMIFLTSFSSASLRRRSQTAPYQIIGYCMSTQTTSSAAQALG